MTTYLSAAAVQSPYSPRPPSPFNTNVSIHSVRSNGYRDQQPLPQQQTLRKKPPNGPAPTAAVGILRALDPHPDLQHQPQQQYRERSDDTQTEFSFREDRYKEDKKEKKGFWDRAKEKTEERDRERQRARERERREDDSQAELTRMIGECDPTSQATMES